MTRVARVAHMARIGDVGGYVAAVRPGWSRRHCGAPTTQALGAATVRRLVEAVAIARYSIVVAAGGGVSAQNAAALLRETGAATPTDSGCDYMLMWHAHAHLSGLQP